MLIKDIETIIAKELNVRPKQVAAAIELLDDGNTVPFIARYRKEATGSLEDEQLRQLEERLSYLRNLVKRQEEILGKIEEQGKLTDELRTAIEKTTKLQELEDLYLPYKQKKRTRAMMARERGLEPLANAMMLQAQTKGSALEEAAKFIDAKKGVETAEDALAGAMDIVAETIMEDAALRKKMRSRLWNMAVLTTSRCDDAAEEDKQVLEMYAEYREPVHTLPSHRILAINRGEKKGALKVKLEIDHEENCRRIYNEIHRQPSIFDDCLRAAIEDGYKRLLLPALEREIRSQLTEDAEAQAIKVFGVNLRQLLLQAPLAGHTVMGLDPGYRNGCKMAVVDATGQVLDHGVLQITQSDRAKEAAAKTVLASIRKNHVTLISIGNGTASYETEQFTAELIRENDLTDVHYIIANEAGASVYSASALAKEELPEYDVVIRGAVSIARRVQDPLAELVKIDPKAIGVGQYQHDVNQKELSQTLDATIESAVNHVGVDLNTASAALLKHIAGINGTIANNIVAYRNENGTFASRRQLLKVPRLGPAAFTQCAGFLRIAGAKSPLDNTPVHPESYKLAEAILAKLGFDLQDLSDKNQLAMLAAKSKLVDIAKLAKDLDAGEPTVKDILDALVKPGRDPREDLPAPLTRQAIVKLSDIKPGTIMRGTVRNITDFGAFVDIGLHQDGLIHISELSKKRVKHPLDVLSIGDVLNVMVISIDEKRNRIGLSLKQVPKEAQIG
ncbi:Tex family protein [Selenomonas ruminis]|uniref:RNA-binding transcriptional accessory protein n=1 Tax=Selenomonas ruminis TaxID=2593411 RepID=A0A5D6W098_9FIRM|nr:Tex family protein [Selenomonas sp. mPRGC5]TYZ20619.1 RNA-binding transcriptional accessory protein [Selenomonas sp. mPRGC5]